MEHQIWVRHNAEIAHRLSQLPGKCQRIHGHSLQIELILTGGLNPNGILAGLDFGSVKQEFRAYIDESYDHHLLLNDNDPFTTLLPSDQSVICAGDPTIENIAMWIGEWAYHNYALTTEVRVQETNTNGAIWRSE